MDTFEVITTEETNNNLVNPFYIDQLERTELKELYKLYDSVLLLCVKNNEQLDRNTFMGIYDEVIDKDTLNNIIFHKVNHINEVLKLVFV